MNLNFTTMFGTWPTEHGQPIKIISAGHKRIYRTCYLRNRAILGAGALFFMIGSLFITGVLTLPTYLRSNGNRQNVLSTFSFWTRGIGLKSPIVLKVAQSDLETYTFKILCLSLPISPDRLYIRIIDPSKKNRILCL